MRLIDADALKICYMGKNSLGTNNNDSKADYASIRKMIDAQPTAYDVDKVVEQLKEMSGIQFDGKNESYQLDWCIDISKAIEIVKGGGQS